MARTLFKRKRKRLCAGAIYSQTRHFTSLIHWVLLSHQFIWPSGVQNILIQFLSNIQLRRMPSTIMWRRVVIIWGICISLLLNMELNLVRYAFVSLSTTYCISNVSFVRSRSKWATFQSVVPGDWNGYIFFSDNAVTPAVDIYAFGMCALEVALCLYLFFHYPMKLLSNESNPARFVISMHWNIMNSCLSCKLACSVSESLHVEFVGSSFKGTNNK